MTKVICRQVLKKPQFEAFFVGYTERRAHLKALFVDIVAFTVERMISAPGCSLSAGRAVSLLVANAPVGSHLSR